MIFHISPLLSMGPFLWAWHPISTAALVQCPPIAGNVLFEALKKLLSVILRLSLPLLCMVAILFQL